jgi:hypothetical protein
VTFEAVEGVEGVELWTLLGAMIPLMSVEEVVPLMQSFDPIKKDLLVLWGSSSETS